MRSDDHTVMTLHPGEPVFAIRGQDLTAPMLVRAWAAANLFLNQGLAKGYSREATLGMMEKRFHRLFLDVTEAAVTPGLDKRLDAIHIAQAMEAWTGHKKVAD